MNVGVAASAI